MGSPTGDGSIAHHGDLNTLERLVAAKLPNRSCSLPRSVLELHPQELARRVGIFFIQDGKIVERYGYTSASERA